MGAAAAQQLSSAAAPLRAHALLLWRRCEIVRSSGTAAQLASDGAQYIIRQGTSLEQLCLRHAQNGTCCGDRAEQCVRKAGRGHVKAQVWGRCAATQQGLAACSNAGRSAGGRSEACAWLAGWLVAATCFDRGAAGSAGAPASLSVGGLVLWGGCWPSAGSASVGA